MATRSPSFEAIHREFHPKVLRYLGWRAGSGGYNDVFLAEDVPEAERHAAARKVADAIVATLKEDGAVRTA